MFPYLDISGFSKRAMMPAGVVSYIEQDTPGFVATRIAVRSSYINSRLRKRYGNAGAGANSLPLGQSPPLLLSSGTSPPDVQFTGRPTLGSLEMGITITTAGPRGTAVFKWTSNGGDSYTTAAVTAASVVLGDTGLTAVFPDTTYSTNNVYTAATPVPEAVLGWLVAMVTYDCYRKRGADPQDPSLVAIKEDLDIAMAELKEAADGKDGLFDLPSSEDEDSAVTTGFPLGYSEASPYVWTDIEACEASHEDYANPPRVRR